MLGELREVGHLAERSTSKPKMSAEQGEPAVEQVTRWLCPSTVALAIDVGDNLQALQAAGEHIARLESVSATAVFRALWRREQAASTAVGAGLAIPHARVAGIAEPLTLYARTKRPIPFGAPDGRPVSELFIIIIPAESTNAEHLKLLSLVAEAFSDQAFCRRLNAARDAATIRAEFNRWIVERDTRLQG